MSLQYWPKGSKKNLSDIKESLSSVYCIDFAKGILWVLFKKCWNQNAFLTNQQFTRTLSKRKCSNPFRFCIITVFPVSHAHLPRIIIIFWHCVCLGIKSLKYGPVAEVKVGNPNTLVYLKQHHKVSLCGNLGGGHVLVSWVHGVMLAQWVHFPLHYLSQFKFSLVLIDLSKALATFLDTPVPFKTLIYEQLFFMTT